jgi:hypothetical protein
MHSSNTSANDNSGNCRPDASQTALGRRDLSALTVEEKITYRKWRLAVLIGYSVAAIIITAISIAQICHENPRLTFYFLRLTTNRLIANGTGVSPIATTALDC